MDEAERPWADAAALQPRRTKDDLRMWVRSAIHRGQLAPGARIPTDMLGRRFDVSRPTVLEALRPLINDGTLTTRPSRGIFVERPTPSAVDRFALVISSRAAYQKWSPTKQVVASFEARCAALGVQPIVVEETDSTGTGVSAAGTVRMLPPRHTDAGSDVRSTGRTVQYLGGQRPLDASSPDEWFLDFDNIAGGAAATRALLFVGKHRIAYAGTHLRDSPHNPWSRQRADGWRSVQRRHQPSGQLWEFLPRVVREPTPGGIAATIAEVARQVVRNVAEIDGCVCSDDKMALAIVCELQREAIPRHDWPALVGFESLEAAHPYLYGSVRPAWDELASRGAAKLYEAIQGRRAAERLELVPLGLVERHNHH